MKRKYERTKNYLQRRNLRIYFLFKGKMLTISELARAFCLTKEGVRYIVQELDKKLRKNSNSFLN